MKVGIIGGGSIAVRHILGYRQIEDVESITLADVNPDFAAKAELEATPNARAVADHREILDDGEIEVVSICLPHDLHERFAVEALEAGKHVITEKPIAMTVQQADNMIATADRVGRRLFVIMNLVFTPYYLRARELIRSGELGRPFLAVFHIEGDELERMSDPTSWKGTPDRAGGGAMVDTGYHAVYMLLDLFGKPEKVGAQARRLVVECEHKMDDNTVATLEFPGGVMASVIVSYSITSKPWAERRYVYCTDGSVDMSDETVETLRVWRDRQVVERQGWSYPEHPHAYSIAQCIAHYLECIETGDDPMVDAFHARETLDTLRAIYESSDTGRMVTL
ncbi:MAG: Gfo/Idh/MocA family oxidoreductase [Phycisphaerae bacterium]|nr:Gfo/Idh/MocA family oxidoreductase [Phycisphaerae bacterium]